MMTSAHYGRMREGRCVQGGYDKQGNPYPIGCSEDIIRYFKFPHIISGGNLELHMQNMSFVKGKVCL